MNGTQRRALVNPWRVYFMNSGASKGTSWAKATSSSEKIKPVSFAIVELRWSEGIMQAGRQAVSRKFHSIKFCSNFLKVFRIDLKSFLGLVLPNQYYHIVKFWLHGFRRIYFVVHLNKLFHPYREPQQWFMIVFPKS